MNNRVRNIIRADLINMGGGGKSSTGKKDKKKKEQHSSLISLSFFVALMMLAAGFLISPFGGITAPLIIASFLPMMIFENEVKYHADKLNALLPVSRRDIVNARFLLTYLILFAVCAGTYLMMLISMKLRLYENEANGNQDALAWMAETAGMSELAVFHLAFCIVLAISIIMTGKSLKSCFLSSGRLAELFGTDDGKKYKYSRQDILEGGAGIAVVVFLMLVITGFIPIGTTASAIIALLKQLATAANGVVLGAVSLVIAGFKTALTYTGLVLDYDKSEL